MQPGMDRYAIPGHMRPPVPPVRVSSLNSSRAMSSNGGRSSENSSLRSGRSAVSIDSGNRTSQESAKPRLSKDQQEYLERRFAEQPKPNTQTKKTFAAELNVPLEKINNWFQNRRAKSKQDARKKQGAYAQFATPHTFVGAPHSFEQSYIDQSFYHMTNPHQSFPHGWQQPVLPGNSVDPSTINPTNAQFNFDLDPSTYIPTHGVSTDHMSNSSLLNDDSNPKGFEAFFGLSNPSHPSDPYALNMYRGQFCSQESFGNTMDTIPEYDIPNSSAAASHFHAMSSGDNTLSRQDTIGSEELSNSISYPPSNGDLPMPPSADFFHPHDTQPDMYPLPTWGQSAGQPFNTNDTTMQDAPLHQPESQLPYRNNNNGLSFHAEAPSALYQSGSSGASFLDRVHVREANELESIDNVNENMVQGSHEPSSAQSSNGVAQRRDSTMSRLVESIDNVNVQPHALEKRPSQQSIGHPSLASRRQRRPAPLGSSSTRSTSFSSTTPASPKPNQPQSSERELRRIKSSIGTVNGRVHKSGLSGAAQKSPLSFTFSDAATSARASKSLSSRSMTSLSIDTVSRTDSLVPATPLSPPSDDLGHIPFAGLDGSYGNPLSAKDDSIWVNMPNTSGSATDSLWSSYMHQQSTDSWINFSSPPDTPMAPQQPSDAAPQSQADQASISVAPSHFTNTWPQSENSGAEQPLHNEPEGFSEPLNLHTEDEPPSHETTQQHHGASNPIFEQSTPSRLNKFADVPASVSNGYENQMQEKSPNAGQEQLLAQAHHQSPTHGQGTRSRRRSDAASLTPQPGFQNSPLAQRASQPRQSGLNMFHVSDPDLRNLEPGQVPSSLMQQATNTPPRPPQALMIHQYSPSDPVPTDRMPPRTHSSDMPKNLTFQMCGPENFSSP